MFVTRWSGLADETADQWIARQRNRADGVSLAVAIDVERVAIGKVALGHLDENAAFAELSYWLVPSMRGKSFATAASLVLCRWGFERLNLRRIRLDIDVDNTASQSVARALGAIRNSSLDHLELDRTGTARRLLAWTISPE